MKLPYNRSALKAAQFAWFERIKMDVNNYLEENFKDGVPEDKQQFVNAYICLADRLCQSLGYDGINPEVLKYTRD